MPNMDDFYKLSAKMKDLFPSDPAADKQALLQMANAPAPDAPPTKDYITESVQVPQGSMPLGIDNVSDFAKLAGITESQKTGSAGQAKGSDPMPTAEPKRTTHPLKDKLVGEEDIDVRALTPAASTVGGAIDPSDLKKPLRAKYYLKENVMLLNHTLHYFQNLSQIQCLDHKLYLCKKRYLKYKRKTVLKKVTDVRKVSTVKDILCVRNNKPQYMLTKVVVI